jgi:hypothetical protein
MLLTTLYITFKTYIRVFLGIKRTKKIPIRFTIEVKKYREIF